MKWEQFIEQNKEGLVGMFSEIYREILGDDEEEKEGEGEGDDEQEGTNFFAMKELMKLEY